MILIYALTLAVALAAMGHEEYSVREWGSRTAGCLVRSNPAAFGPPVSNLAGSSPCPETRSRCSRLCPAYNAWLADTYLLRSTKWPTCDWGLAAAGQIPDWRWWFDQVPCGMPDECSPTWSRYRAASELYVRTQIRYGRWSHADADRAVRAGWLAEMRIIMERYPGSVATVEPWSRP